jgi:hypothetical protein
MIVTVMLTGMFSSPAWAEPITIAMVAPRTDSTNDLSFRHEQPSLMIPFVPWLAMETLKKAFSIDTGSGPAFFSNFKSLAWILAARSESSARSAPVSMSFQDCF